MLFEYSFVPSSTDMICYSIAAISIGLLESKASRGSNSAICYPLSTCTLNSQAKITMVYLLSYLVAFLHIDYAKQPKSKTKTHFYGCTSKEERREMVRTAMLCKREKVKKTGEGDIVSVSNTCRVDATSTNP